MEKYRKYALVILPSCLPGWKASRMENVDEESTVMKALKYFAHGFLFSLVSTVFAAAGLAIWLFLVVVGSIIGLIIGIGLVILILGFTNAMITDFIWGTSTDRSIVSLFLHGLFLFIMLLIVGTVPAAIALMLSPGIATAIVFFLISCFLSGFCGRFVASFWEEDIDR